MDSSEAQQQERIRRAAEETLRRWPAAQAAVLFGSRARGEHRPDSDWDIAIITARSGPRPDGLPLFNLDYTDIPVLTAERIRRRANALGAVECEIVRDGTLLAGHWDRPLIEGKPVMTEEDYKKWIAGALGHAVEVVMQLQVAASTSDWVLASTACDGFVAATADAAERVGKGVLARQGIHPHRTHDMSLLAQQIENHLKNQEQTSAQGQAYLRRLPSRLRALNGDTRRDHKSDYPEVPVSAAECVRAGRRLVRMLALWSDEIKQTNAKPLAASGVVAAARMRDDLNEAIREKDGTPSEQEQQAFAAAMKCRTRIARSVQYFADRMNALTLIDPAYTSGEEKCDRN